MKRIIISILIGVLLVGCREESPRRDDRLVITATIDPAERYVATVNGVGIPQRDFDRAVQVFGDPEAALAHLTDERLIQAYATAHGIFISASDVDAEVQTLQTLAAENQREIAQITGYPADQLEDYVRWTLLVSAVGQDLSQELPSTVMQVQARHILVNEEAQALEILRQLDAGADFGELARQHSQDPATAPLGGDLGWIAPNDLLQSAVEDILFEMPANSRWAQPIPSILGYHIVESLAQAERPLDKEQLARMRQKALNEWLEQQRNDAIIERYVASS